MQRLIYISIYSLTLELVAVMAGGALAAEPAKGSNAHAADEIWKAGVARVIITPQEAIWMGGYGSRDRPAEGKLQDLFAKALALEDPAGQRLILVTTDLVGMSAKLTEAVALELNRKHHLARAQILFTSSHTHCGPALADNDRVWYPLTPQQELKAERYTERLRGQLVEVVGAALAELAPARLWWGNGRAGFAVNRRQPTPQGVINGTNRAGPVDHDVPVLRVESPQGKLRAIAFGYACHNTTLAFYQWCGDYAGFAQEYLERAHPDATALFFMGCGGDANPLPRSTVQLCEKYGRQLASAVEAVLSRKMQAIEGTAKAAFARIALPLDRLAKRPELENQAQAGPTYMQRRAVSLLKILDARGKFDTTYPYPIQVWQLDSQLTWVALGGEAVVDYSHRLKRELGPTTWVTAYANDVMAYIPSLRVLREGGYEATIVSGGIAGSAWAPAAEERIIDKVHELVSQVRGAPQKTAHSKLRVVVIGAHPDDPESGCGGLIALLTKAGHEVIAAYTTCYRGDRKIGNEPEGVVRRREATAACQLLGAEPHFFDYAHERLLADQSTLEAVSAWLDKVQPDIVVTHWPLDTHPNHHVTSSLVWQCYLRQEKWSLYFFEVETDQQTMNFRPELYLDIENVYALKKKALFRHESQQPEGIWKLHDAMHRRRGAECGIKHAEAYLRASPQKGRAPLPVSLLCPKK